FAAGNTPVTAVVKSTPESVPPRVRLPAAVTVPVRVNPLTVPAPPTDVTVPVPATANHSTSVSPALTASTLPALVASEGSSATLAPVAVAAPVPPSLICTVSPVRLNAPLAVRVVNAPGAGVVDPIAPLNWDDVTLVKPPKVVAVAPSEMAVEPIVTELLVSAAFPILVSVLLAPVIVLLVR